MRVLHFYKTYLSETAAHWYGVEPESGAPGIESQVLTLSANPVPAVIPFGQHQVHRAKLEVDLASLAPQCQRSGSCCRS